jgi:hypothetical protein
VIAPGVVIFRVELVLASGLGVPSARHFVRVGTPTACRRQAARDHKTPYPLPQSLDYRPGRSSRVNRSPVVFPSARPIQALGIARSAVTKTSKGPGSLLPNTDMLVARLRGLKQKPGASESSIVSAMTVLFCTLSTACQPLRLRSASRTACALFFSMDAATDW